MPRNPSTSKDEAETQSSATSTIEKEDTPSITERPKDVVFSNQQNPVSIPQPEVVWYYNGSPVQILKMLSTHWQIKVGSQVLDVMKSDLTQRTGLGIQSTTDVKGQVNINTATLDDLMTLNTFGIRSEYIANTILNNRRGGYNDFNHFRQLNSSLSSLNFDGMKPFVTF